MIKGGKFKVLNRFKKFMRHPLPHIRDLKNLKGTYYSNSNFASDS